MFSGQITIPQEITTGIRESKNVYNSLEDFPMWMRVLGVGFSQASRGQRIYREIKSVSDEVNTPQLPKFKQYLDAIKAPAIGFHRGLTSNLTEGNKQVAFKLAGDITREMFEAGNRQAAIRRIMIRNQVPISQIRQITDPETRVIRNTIPTTLRNAFDRQSELPETQLLEMAMILSQDS